MTDHALLASLRRVAAGCIHCGEPATQLVKPSRPGEEYAAVCPHHMWNPDDQCSDPDHDRGETHGPGCDAEVYEMLPLDELLDQLGVAAVSPHKAEARFIGTILAIAAASCLVSAVGGLAAAATRGDWIMVAALALVLAPTPFTVWVVATAWRRYTGRADHCIEIAIPLLKSIETDADSVTLTLTRAGRHYLADRP